MHGAYETMMVKQELSAVRGFILFAGSIIFMFSVGTHLRNRTWRNMGDLWLDIIQKAHATRILDPETGKEAPRSKRARIYNNIGLYLYNQARDLSHARADIVKLIARYEEAKKRSKDLMTPVMRRRLRGMERRIVELYDAIEAYKPALFDHIPLEFMPECRCSGAGRETLNWDLFLPAELCLRKALFHHANYFRAHLNLALVIKLRAHYRFTAGSPGQRREMDQAARHLQVVCAIMPIYEKGLRYLANILMRLGRFRQARDAARRALANHVAEQGSRALFAQIRIMIEASRKLKDYKVALEWIDVALRLGPSNPQKYRDMREVLLQEMKDSD